LIVGKIFSATELGRPLSFHACCQGGYQTLCDQSFFLSHDFDFSYNYDAGIAFEHILVKKNVRVTYSGIMARPLRVRDIFSNTKWKSYQKALEQELRTMCSVVENVFPVKGLGVLIRQYLISDGVQFFLDECEQKRQEKRLRYEAQLNLARKNIQVLSKKLELLQSYGRNTSDSD